MIIISKNIFIMQNILKKKQKKKILEKEEKKYDYGKMKAWYAFIF